MASDSSVSDVEVLQNCAVAHVGTVVQLVASLPLTQPGSPRLAPPCLPQLLLALSACLCTPPAAERLGPLDEAGFQVTPALQSFGAERLCVSNIAGCQAADAAPTARAPWQPVSTHQLLPARAVCLRTCPARGGFSEACLQLLPA